MKKLYIILVVICLLFATACSNKNSIKNDSLDNYTQSDLTDETSEYSLDSTEFALVPTDSPYNTTTVTNTADTTTNTKNNSGSVNKLGTKTTETAPVNNVKKVDTPVTNIFSSVTTATNSNQNSSSNSSSSQSSTTTTNPQPESYDITMKAKIINWVNDGNIVYTLTSSPNELWVFNVATMKTLTTISLPGTPAEIQLDNNQILISFPTLQSINYYDKTSFVETKSIHLPHIVSSFAFDNGFVYYTEDDQWCNIYRTNLSDTTKTDKIVGYYYFPKILINKQDNLLYVIESSTTGSKVHYINLSDLTLQSETSGYGYDNISRYAYFDGQYLYAMNFKIDKTNASHIVGEYVYKQDYWDGVTFVNNDFIITDNAIYSKDTLAPVLVFNSSFNKSLITSNNTLLLYNNQDLYIIPSD